MPFITFKVVEDKKSKRFKKVTESDILKEIKNILLDIVMNEMVPDGKINAKKILNKDSKGLLSSHIKGFVKIIGKVVIAGLRIDLKKVPYARIQEKGGITQPKVTEKSRKFFWFKFFKTKEKKWKRMALTKKDNFKVKIPARPYLLPAIEKSVPLIKSELKKMDLENIII